MVFALDLAYFVLQVREYDGFVVIIGVSEAVK